MYKIVLTLLMVNLSYFIRSGNIAIYSWNCTYLKRKMFPENVHVTLEIIQYFIICRKLMDFLMITFFTHTIECLITKLSFFVKFMENFDIQIILRTFL